MLINFETIWKMVAEIVVKTKLCDITLHFTFADKREEVEAVQGV